MDQPHQRTIACEQIAKSGLFRHLSSIAGIGHDLRYGTPDNFAGRDVYGPLDCAWLHADAAAALEKSVAFLAMRNAGARLLVLDALRPQRVQETLWAVLQGTGLEQYLAPPERGSIHSFGMAVDITIADAHGAELDMGTPFDELTELSHPKFEARFLAEGKLSAAQIANRTLLRDTMEAGGFHGISTEWWHFDCGDRAVVRQTYLRVL
jgi:zinc D-Ala-D-Ala dipeptidase